MQENLFLDFRTILKCNFEKYGVVNESEEVVSQLSFLGLYPCFVFLKLSVAETDSLPTSGMSVPYLNGSFNELI